MWENTPEELAQFAEEKRTQGRRDFFSNLLYRIHAENRSKKNINMNIDVEQYATTVLRQTEIRSVSGGSCWNEDDHYDNAVSDKKIQNELYKSFLYEFLLLIKDLNIPVMQLEDWLTEKVSKMGKYSAIREYEQQESYGNSTTYGIFGLKIEDVVEKFCDEETKEIYHNELKDFQEKSTEEINQKNRYKHKY